MSSAEGLARTRDQMLIEAGLTLAAELELDAVLQHIVDLATEITGARYGALGVLSDARRIERFITTGISEVERARIGDPPTGHGILGMLIDHQQPIRLTDLTRDPRSHGFPPHHPPMRSFLGAPVRAFGRVYGNIYLTDKRDADTFSEDDEAALVVLATQAGVAIENARLYEETQRAQHELRRLEVLEERERIAKELHDGIVQSLFAVGMGLQGAAALAHDPEIAARLENAVEDIDSTIRDLRNYIFGLRPGILADRQLDEAIRELCGEFAARTDVVTVADIDDGVAAELASRAADVIQLVREGLSNVGRHANATTCRVSLRRVADGGIELQIDDDGKGFDVNAPRDGMGLTNLAARVDSMGGTFRAESIAGDGTTITAVLPA
ncbi:MAG TPA: GAF domain-containing sensor histidine kinase [Actinomycetota bacterium]|nr:GAF domain-containing sensor histidine kinase [Actinomycetota bacterium]